MSHSRRHWLVSCAFFLMTSMACAQQAIPVRSAAATGLPAQASAVGNDVFLVKPYIQLGDAPTRAAAESLVLMWHTVDQEAPWSVEYQPAPDGPWKQAAAPEARKVAVPTIDPHRVYRATLKDLVPGGEFAYRVKKSGEVVFAAVARACKSADQPYRVVVFGDCAAGTPAQRAVAYQAFLAKPDFVMIPGDIVYARGRISEYRKNYWPVYNSDEAGPTQGAPLLRSTLFLAAPGNHDLATRDLRAYPDGQAYYLYWSQPLNGPLATLGAAGTPTLTGPEANQQAFLEAAGTAYPRMANFSFDYGNAHWTVVDSNTYVDWTDPALRAWVARDLASARGATWRFVAFHHPGFNSAKTHFSEQRLRLLAPVFEAGGADIVFTGHVHNYQRTYPLRFAPETAADGQFVVKNGRVDGVWTLDKNFDGQAQTRPDGVIYLVTGAGGAGLYDPGQTTRPETWQPFTFKFLAETHSLTIVDVSGRSLSVRQITDTGAEMDRFTVTK